MSRNLRHNPNGSPVPKKSKKTPRRTVETSDDDDYSGVDLISDSEGDEPDVLRAEKQAIIKSEEDEDDHVSQPTFDDDQSSWNGFDFDDNPSLLGDASIFDDHMAGLDVNDMYSGSNSWSARRQSISQGIDSGHNITLNLSDDESDEDEDDSMFPDIFLDQSSLDPAFRYMIEHNKDGNDDLESNGSSTYWDLEDAPAAEVVEEGSVHESSSSYSESEDDSDAETTEDEMPVLATRSINPNQSVLRRESTDSSASEVTEVVPVPRRHSFRRPGRGPRLGTFAIDNTKPYILFDHQRGKVTVFNGRDNKKYKLNEAQNRKISNMIAIGSHQDESPMISNSGNLMMSAMDTNANGFAGDVVGPPEAFFPWITVGANGQISQDSASDDDDTFEDDNFLNELIDFGDDDDDEAVDGDEQDSSESPTGADPLVRSKRPTTATSEEAHPLFDHFNNHDPNAFRRNQNRHALIARNIATRDSLAFSSPYNDGVIRGIKGGHLAAANAPITPGRKRRPTVNVNLISSPSPMDPSGDRKRKALSGDAPSHKRNRSIV